MVYTIGIGWAILYFFLAIAFIALSIWRFADWSENSNRGLPIGGIAFLVLVLVSGYLAIFAATHFRVGINERALLINNIDGKIIGTKEAGVNSKPLFGVTVQIWPANQAYPIVLDLQPGTASATSSDKIALWVDAKLYLDLSKLDLERAYRAVNGDFKVFHDTYLLPQLMNQVRNTSKNFSVDAHSAEKDRWAEQFDLSCIAFFGDASEGYGIAMVPGRTIMSYDFVNADDAAAYDQANRSSFLKVQRQNEQEALNIELAMAKTRGEMLRSTSQGVTASWQDVVAYIQSQPPETQAFLLRYMEFQANMEYLRLVAQQQPATIFPPGMAAPAAVFNTAPIGSTVVNSPTATPTVTK